MGAIAGAGRTMGAERKGEGMRQPDPHIALVDGVRSSTMSSPLNFIGIHQINCASIVVTLDDPYPKSLFTILSASVVQRFLHSFLRSFVAMCVFVDHNVLFFNIQVLQDCFV